MCLCKQTSLAGGSAAGRALQQPDPHSGFVGEHLFHLREFQGNSLLGLWHKKMEQIECHCIDLHARASILLSGD